jgi:hypothetical protein
LGLFKSNEEVDDDKALLEEEDNHEDGTDVLENLEDFDVGASNCDDETLSSYENFEGFIVDVSDHDDTFVKKDNPKCLSSIPNSNSGDIPSKNQEDKASDENNTLATICEEECNNNPYEHFKLNAFLKQNNAKSYVLYFYGPPQFDGESFFAQEGLQVMGTNEQSMAIPDHDGFVVQKMGNDIRIYKKHKEHSSADDVHRENLFSAQEEDLCLMLQGDNILGPLKDVSINIPAWGENFEFDQYNDLVEATKGESYVEELDDGAPVVLEESKEHNSTRMEKMVIKLAIK